MGPVQLLDRTRKVRQLLHNNNSHKIAFSDICKVLKEILSSNVLVISEKGELLGVDNFKEIQPIKELLVDQVGDFIDQTLNDRLLRVLSTKENVNLETLGFQVDSTMEFQAVITPINAMGKRLGTVFAYKQNEPYRIDDIILCEYGTTVISLEMLRSLQEGNAEERRKERVIKSAMGTLSYSEMDAIALVFEDLNGTEGILVASKIADRAGITRSIIVNALRKLESAGVVESRSSGMKGTYIKVLNDLIFDEIVRMNESV